MERIEGLFERSDVERLKLRGDDVSVPAALMLLFPDSFDSQTRARKESRRRRVLLHRGPLSEDDADDVFDRERLAVGKVGDRV